MNINREIIIKLNPNYQMDRENYISSQENDLAYLILDRVQKYENFLQNNYSLSDEEIYDRNKRYDSIHIDGARGLGKSTVLKFLSKSEDCSKCKELHEKIEFLSLIDPNQLDKDTNIIDIVTDLIYQKIKSEHDKMPSKNMDIFKNICDIKSKIDKLTFKTYTKNYENAHVKADATTKERQLDYIFHRFVMLSCTLLNKKALVLPLDDIDMRLDVGVIILETIRKYFQTPHLIPVIALDSNQAYALVKKLYYEEFGYEAKTPNRDIKAGSGMDFLKKLPSEYLQKILPPSQRIALFDILEYYKEEYNREEPSIFFYKELKNNSEVDLEIKLSFKCMIKLIMNILFNYVDVEDDYNPDDFHIVNYLKNKSFRSFLDDARALLRGLEFDENFEYDNKKIHSYRLNTRHLKTRFQLYSRGGANSKYDGAIWFWDRYLERIYTELDRVGRKDDYYYYYKVNHIIIDLLEEVLIIDPHDTSSLGRKEKIYYRLFLQEFFIDQINIEFSNHNKYNRVEKIIKTYNMRGYIEFLMRTIFPASLFEILVNERILSVMKFPIEQLRDFALSNNKKPLVKLYDEWIPFWTEMYPTKLEDDNGETIKINPLAIKLKHHDTRPFRKDILSFTTKENLLEGNQTYYYHPFKLLSFLAEYYPNSSDDFYYSYMPKGYLNKRSGGLKNFKDEIKYYSQSSKKDDVLSTTFKDDNIIFGIVNSIEMIKDFSNNILLTLMVKPQDIQKTLYSHLRKEYKLDDRYINLLYKIELRKNLSTVSSSLLNILLEKTLTQSSYYRDTESSIKFDIDSSPILSGVNKESILLPFVIDDPLLKNIKLFSISKLSKKYNIIEYMRMIFHISSLDKIYYPKDKNTLNILSDKSFSYSKTDNIAISKLLKNHQDLQYAYLALFIAYIKINKMKTKFNELIGLSKKIHISNEDIKIFLEVNNKLFAKLKKIKFKSKPKVLTIRDFQYQWVEFFKKSNNKTIVLKKYDEILTILKSKKENFLKEEKYIDYNITILLIDIIQIRPKTIQLFEREEARKEENNAS